MDESENEKREEKWNQKKTNWETKERKKDGRSQIKLKLNKYLSLTRIISDGANVY